MFTAFGHQKRGFSKTVLGVEIFVNAGLSFTIGRTKTEDLGKDFVICHILLVLRLFCIRDDIVLSYFRRFSVFMWTGAKTIQIRRATCGSFFPGFLKTEKKSPFSKFAGFVFTGPKFKGWKYDGMTYRAYAILVV